MKKAIYIVLLVLLFACKQEPPYWKTDSFGLISSLTEGDTLKIRVLGRGFLFNGFDHLHFFIQDDSLYTSYEESEIYYIPKQQRRDTILLWRNNPINISDNKLILDCYKVFEQRIKSWNDTTNTCSAINEYSICFNKETLTVVDKSCKLTNFYLALTTLIQEGTALSDIYSITTEYADSIKLKEWAKEIEVSNTNQ